MGAPVTKGYGHCRQEDGRAHIQFPERYDAILGLRGKLWQPKTHGPLGALARLGLCLQEIACKHFRESRHSAAQIRCDHEAECVMVKT